LGGSFRCDGVFGFFQVIRRENAARLGLQIDFQFV
jgi:hypothetical protein